MDVMGFCMIIYGIYMMLYEFIRLYMMVYDFTLFLYDSILFYMISQPPSGRYVVTNKSLHFPSGGSGALNY